MLACSLIADPAVQQDRKARSDQLKSVSEDVVGLVTYVMVDLIHGPDTIDFRPDEVGITAPRRIGRTVEVPTLEDGKPWIALEGLASNPGSPVPKKYVRTIAILICLAVFEFETSQRHVPEKLQIPLWKGSSSIFPEGQSFGVR